MKRIWTLLAGAGLLVLTGCPITEEVGEPEASLYGRIKADAAYNSAATLATPASTSNSSGDFMQLVSDDTAGDNTLAITQRETRLGVKFDMGEALTGKAEWDFYAGGTDNKPNLLLRHLFVKMDLGDGMGLVAGQTSDVFSPILPATINYGWGWNCGNPGYRRPQFRFEYAKEGLLIQAAAARSIDAEAAMRPDIQARVGYKHEKVTVGGSYVTGVTDAAATETLSGLAVDFDAKLGEKASLRGEWYTGENLSDYLAGIGAGPGLTSTGLWIQFALQATDNLKVNIGWMYDDPTGVAANEPDSNSCLFVNLRNKLNDNTEAAVEVSSWATAYAADTTYTNLRVQGSMIFTF